MLTIITNLYVSFSVIPVLVDLITETGKLEIEGSHYEMSFTGILSHGSVRSALVDLLFTLIHVPARLKHPLGVREAGVRSPTVSHQRRKNWEVCAAQLGAWH